MINIIKSQIYSIKHDMYTYVCLLIMFTLSFAAVIMTLNDSGSAGAAGSLVLLMTSDSSIFGVLGGTVLFSTRLSGWDFNDKTVNYEVLYGHQRTEIYWARVITTLTFSCLLAMIFLLVPMLVCTVANGWGYSLELGDALFRIANVMLSVVRISCVFIFLTVLLRNSWASLCISYILLMIESLSFVMIEELEFDFDINYIFSFMDMLKKFEFESVRYEYINGMDIPVSKIPLDSAFVMNSGIAAVVVIVVSLFGGYFLFRKRDMQ